MNRRHVVILLAEDNSTDVMIMREALETIGAKLELHVVSDGVGVLAFLARQAPYAQAPRPDLILLDLNMPRMNGIEVLTHIKTDAQLRTIPVLMLTTSGSEDDVTRAYAAHANCYIQKPVELTRTIALIRDVMQFWLTQVTLTGH
jgi:CheY-like chemotaxis protein